MNQIVSIMGTGIVLLADILDRTLPTKLSTISTSILGNMDFCCLRLLKIDHHFICQFIYLCYNVIIFYFFQRWHFCIIFNYFLFQNRLYLHIMEQLRKKYEAEADLMGSKSRFGFFSIPPSHTAAKTDYNKKQSRKSPDGRVTVENRNIFSGSTSCGVLKKTYFSVPKSIYNGDPYDKPTKSPPKHHISKQGQKQIFKPAKLNKTLAWPAYKYICDNPHKKNAKINRREDGGVITKSRNICANPLSKITQEQMKTFKYSESDYDNFKKQTNQQLKKSISMRRGEGPFKAGNPVKQFFATNIQAFNDHQLKKKKKISSQQKSHTVNHQQAFKPSSCSRNDLFSYPQHQSDMKPTPAKKKMTKKQEPFRLLNKKQISKPCPSIAYSKINIMRNIR